jgi:hypothetical protein
MPWPGRLGPVMAVLALALGGAITVHAQDSVGQSMADGAWESVRSAAGGAAAAVASLFVAPDPFDYLPDQMPERGRQFLALMDAAGYPLSAIHTGGGWFGHVAYRFQQQRQASPGDLERVRRGLEQHAARYSGATARAERRALRGLLALADAPGFRAETVEVEVLPWPEVRFHLAPRDFAAPAPP